MTMYRISDIALSAGVSIHQVWDAVHKLGLEPDRRGGHREPFFREDHFNLILREVGKTRATERVAAVEDSESW
jgi:hypothetical protein